MDIKKEATRRLKKTERKQPTQNSPYPLWTLPPYLQLLVEHTVIYRKEGEKKIMGFALFLCTVFFVLQIRAIELPQFPNHFSFGIEVTNISDSSTFTMHEFIDVDNGKLRVDFHYQGKHHISILDFSINMRYEITHSVQGGHADSSCKQFPMNNTEFPGDGHGHLLPPSRIFLFGEKYNEIYVGQSSIRNIKVDTWKNHLDVHFNNFHIVANTTTSFSALDWKYPSYENYRAPVRSTVEGTFNGHPVHLVYDLFAFNPSEINPRVFRPVGLICSGELSDAANVPLPSLPDQFVTVVEANILEKNYTTLVFEAYDFVGNRARFDFRRRNELVSNIEFYGSNIRYELHHENTTYHSGSHVSSCTFANVSDFTKDNHGHLQRSADFFHFSKEFNESYHGIHRIRGIPAHHWISLVNHTSRFAGVDFQMEYSVSYFFAMDRWDIHGNPHTSVPLRCEIEGVSSVIASSVPAHLLQQCANTTAIATNRFIARLCRSINQPEEFHHIYEFIHFVPGPPPDHMFEVPGHLICHPYERHPNHEIHYEHKHNSSRVVRAIAHLYPGGFPNDTTISGYAIVEQEHYNSPVLIGILAIGLQSGHTYKFVIHEHSAVHGCHTAGKHLSWRSFDTMTGKFIDVNGGDVSARVGLFNAAETKNGVSRTEYATSDEILSLHGTNSIVGRGLSIIHAGTDEVVACGTISALSKFSSISIKDFTKENGADNPIFHICDEDEILDAQEYSFGALFAVGFLALITGSLITYMGMLCTQKSHRAVFRPLGAEMVENAGV